MLPTNMNTSKNKKKNYFFIFKKDFIKFLFSIAKITQKNIDFKLIMFFIINIENLNKIQFRMYIRKYYMELHYPSNPNLIHSKIPKD